MSPLIGILSVILVFAVCFLTVVAVKIITAYVKLKKYMNKNEEPERNPKIYYITEKIKPPKRRKRSVIGRSDQTRRISAGYKLMTTGSPVVIRLSLFTVYPRYLYY